MYKHIPVQITGGSNATTDTLVEGRLIGFLMRSSLAADIWVEVKEGYDYYTLSHVNGRYLASLADATDLRALYLAEEVHLTGQLIRFRSSVAQTSTVTLNFIVDVP